MLSSVYREKERVSGLKPDSGTRRKRTPCSVFGRRSFAPCLRLGVRSWPSGDGGPGDSFENFETSRIMRTPRGLRVPASFRGGDAFGGDCGFGVGSSPRTIRATVGGAFSRPPGSRSPPSARQHTGPEDERAGMYGC